MKPLTILYVEDDENDVYFLRRAISAAKLDCAVCTVPDGLHAEDYLAGIGKYADRSVFPLPMLVLLDIKLPLASGFEVLSWLRQQSSFRRLPIVMLTSSQ